MHISSLTNKFVSDPREVVKAGDIVKVKVVEVDPARKRISLTMRLDDNIEASGTQHKAKPSTTHFGDRKPSANQPNGHNNKPNKQHAQKSHKPKEANNAIMGNAFADAFAKLKK